MVLAKDPANIAPAKDPANIVLAKVPESIPRLIEQRHSEQYKPYGENYVAPRMAWGQQQNFNTNMMEQQKLFMQSLFQIVGKGNNFVWLLFFITRSLHCLKLLGKGTFYISIFSKTEILRIAHRALFKVSKLKKTFFFGDPKHNQ